MDDSFIQMEFLIPKSNRHQFLRKQGNPSTFYIGCWALTNLEKNAVYQVSYLRLVYFILCDQTFYLMLD